MMSFLSISFLLFCSPDRVKIRRKRNEAIRSYQLNALGVALSIMVVNVLLSVFVVAVYSYTIEPGRDAAFYETAAQRIAPWSSVVFGAPLFFGAIFWRSRKKPERNPVLFGMVSFSLYAAIDLSVLFAAGGVLSLLGIIVLSMTTKLLGAYAGARAAQKTPTC
jgi:hypothetical protein